MTVKRVEYTQKNDPIAFEKELRWVVRISFSSFEEAKRFAERVSAGELFELGPEGGL